LYNLPNRPPSISEGLIRGTISSGFGTSQLNRDIIDSDPECQRLQARIRDSTLLIALEAMCLTSIVEIPQVDEDEEEDGMYEDTRGNGTLLKSKDSILGLNLFLLEKSEDLAANAIGEEGKEVGLASWPISVLCLAWSVVLRSLPAELQPSSLGYQEEMYVEFATRALKLRSGLFPWLEWILLGPLFSTSEVVEGLDMARRKVVKGESICTLIQNGYYGS